MTLPPPLDRAEYASKLRSSQRLVMASSATRLRLLQQLTRCIEDCQQAVDYARQQHPEIQYNDTRELEQAGCQLASQLALSVIVFGRSNTGKSTLLNQILRQWPDQPRPAAGGSLFPAAENNCSARIATVCYGPVKEARVIDPPRASDGAAAAPVVLEQRAFQASGEIRDFMDLHGDKRESVPELRKYVEIQLPHPLLQDRLRLVDSPGMGEKPEMNQVVREFLAQVKSGIIIYVIDGKVGYKPDPDSENIKFLMEQTEALQKLIVANRVDFDFDAWYRDELTDSEAEWDLEDDPMEEILEGLKDTKEFDYTAKCVSHTEGRMEAVRHQVRLHHPDCLGGDGADRQQSAASLMGVSAKSVKDFIADELVLAHPPYVDSFLRLERRLTGLVLENGRRHLLAAAQTAKRQLVQAKTLSINFYGDRSEKSDQMMRLMERSISTLREIFRHTGLSLNSVLECDSLDLSSPGSELNRLKMRYAREDASPGMETSLMMREAEAQLIQSLVRSCGGTREARAAIRLLCDFKDAVVSRLRTILIWNYKMIFMVEANRPLSRLDAQCRSLLDSLKQQSAQADDGKTCEDVIDLVRSHVFSPDPDAFSDVCTARLTESMRLALAAVTKRDAFRRITDSLTPQFSRTVEERETVLNYFMETVDLHQQMADVIIAYGEQLREQKVFVDNLLGALLQNMREQGMRTREHIESMREHNDKMAAMAFYIDALVTEANWTADYDIGLQEFQNECGATVGAQSERRQRRRLAPRFAQDVSGGGHGQRAELQLHYRLFRLRQHATKRFASDVALTGSRLAGPVRLQWLCLADTYRGFTEDDPEVPLMVGFDGDYASLAELPPASLTDADRVAWLASLLDCCARLGGLNGVGGGGGSGGDNAYRPCDYRPSCVLLRRLAPGHNGEGEDESEGEGDSGLSLSSEAFPDPTRLAGPATEAPPRGGAAASLAACAVALFTYGEAVDGDGEDDVHGWDARHSQELRLAVECGGGERMRYLAGLQRRLALLPKARPKPLSVAVARCVRVCLEISDAAAAPTAVEQLQESRRALLSAVASEQSERQQQQQQPQQPDGGGPQVNHQHHSMAKAQGR